MSRLPNAEEIAAAARQLADGGLVAFPTETVYGLGADAADPAAVGRIYAAKGRPSNHPVIVHIAPEAQLSDWARDIPQVARDLAEAFWPGPLTLILKRADGVPDAVSGGQDSVGVRCPSHPVAQALLREFARLRPGQRAGVAGPSANRYGKVSPTRAEHVRSEFPAQLEDGTLLVLEGGASDVGIESTILDVSRVQEGVGPVLLRPGHITPEQIASVTGSLPARPDAQAPRASGTLKAHYAPLTPVRLCDSGTLVALLAERAAGAAGPALAVLVHDPSGIAPALRGNVPGIAWRHVTGGPDAYARQLYALLRELDAGGHQAILVQRLPEDSSWDAVRDRLGRAAAAFE